MGIGEIGLIQNADRSLQLILCQQHNFSQEDIFYKWNYVDHLHSGLNQLHSEGMFFCVHVCQYEYT